MFTSCVQDIENISSCEFYVFLVVPNKLGKFMKYEAKKKMLIIFLETSNIEWGQIDPKGNMRVKCFHQISRVTFRTRTCSADSLPGMCLGQMATRCRHGSVSCLRKGNCMRFRGSNKQTSHQLTVVGNVDILDMIVVSLQL